MKSSSFRASPAPESSPNSGKSKRINWDKIVYISILMLVVLLLGRFVGYEALHVESDGQFMFESFDVRFSSDVQVVGYAITKDEVVDAGAELFQYVVIKDLEDPRPSHRDVEMKWLDAEADLVQEIEMKTLVGEKEEEMLAYNQEQLTRIREGLSLGIYTVDKLESYERREADLTSNLKALRAEIAVLQRRLRAHREVRPEAESAPEISQVTRIYRSPVAGRVTQVLRKEWETVPSSNPILTVRLTDSDQLIVRALFEKGDLKYVGEQDHVSLAHSNGAKSRGYVSQIRAMPAGDPLRIDEQFSLLNKYAVADIHPLTEQDRELWTQLRNLGVTITKRKF